jgi:hypothetical protein
VPKRPSLRPQSDLWRDPQVSILALPLTALLVLNAGPAAEPEPALSVEPLLPDSV